MAALKIYNGSSWVTAVAKTYNGSAWEDQMKFYDGAAWQELYASGPVVSATVNGRTNFLLGGSCYSGARFYTTGVEYEITSTNGSVSMGNWLDSGAASEVWVEFIRTGGNQTNFVGLTSGVRYQLSSNRSFYVRALLNQFKSITGYFKFWDAASGGTLLQQTSSAT